MTVDALTAVLTDRTIEIQDGGRHTAVLRSIERAQFRRVESDVPRHFDASRFSGDTSMEGWSTEDVMIGGSGADVLLGLIGRDVLTGGAGRDTLDGGRGNDTCDGGPGQDRIVRC